MGRSPVGAIAPEVESHRDPYSPDDCDGRRRPGWRRLAEADRDIRGAFPRYEAHRKPRTSRIQATSSANTWMKGGNDDTPWLYGYDAWNVPLNEPALNPAS